MRSPSIYLALLTVQLLFAVHYVAAKWVLETVPAPAWVALRVAGAALVLVVMTANRWHEWPRDRRTWLELAGLAMFGVVINQVLFIEGLSRTWPSHSALINTSIPVTTLLIAVALGREDLGWRKVAALALSLLGRNQPIPGMAPKRCGGRPLRLLRTHTNIRRDTFFAQRGIRNRFTLVCRVMRSES